MNYLKKILGKILSWLQTGQFGLAGLPDCSRLRGDWFHSSPFLIATWLASSPVPQQSLVPQVWALTLPGTSVWAWSLSCHRGSTVWLGGEEAGAAVAGEFPKQPLSVSFFTFSFWEIPPANACQSIQGRACPLIQPTSPARLGTIRVRAHHSPALNSPPANAHSLRGCSPPLCVCYFTLIPLPVASSNQCLSRWCSNLVWQGREPLTWFSPKSPAADLGGTGPGAAATLVSALVPVTLLSCSTLLTTWFFNDLYNVWSPIFIYPGVLLAACSVPSRSARCFIHVQGEVESAPTYLTAILESPGLLSSEHVENYTFLFPLQLDGAMSLLWSMDYSKVWGLSISGQSIDL